MSESHWADVSPDLIRGVLRIGKLSSFWWQVSQNCDLCLKARIYCWQQYCQSYSPWCDRFISFMFKKVLPQTQKILWVSNILASVDPFLTRQRTDNYCTRYKDKLTQRIRAPPPGELGSAHIQSRAASTELLVKPLGSMPRHTGLYRPTTMSSFLCKSEECEG